MPRRRPRRPKTASRRAQEGTGGHEEGPEAYFRQTLRFFFCRNPIKPIVLEGILAQSATISVRF